MDFLLVFLGAGLGGAARHGVNLLTARLLGPDGSALATLSVNVAGSLLLGLVLAWALRNGLSPHLRLLLTTGILGGFTTFSAFSSELVLLLERGRIGAALAYGLASVSLSAGALAAAMLLARAVLGAGAGR